jgi:hypothetical protein
VQQCSKTCRLDKPLVRASILAFARTTKVTAFVLLLSLNVPQANTLCKIRCRYLLLNACCWPAMLRHTFVLATLTRILLFFGDTTTQQSNLIITHSNRKDGG